MGAVRSTTKPLCSAAAQCKTLSLLKKNPYPENRPSRGCANMSGGGRRCEFGARENLPHEAADDAGDDAGPEENARRLQPKLHGQ
jgi:hypothetical protein